jgi:hypothetical protein
MQYITLNHVVNFYVPSTRLTEAMSPECLKSRTDEIAELFTGFFGGATIEHVTGWYRIQSGEKSGVIVTEIINKIVSYCDDEALEKHLPEVLQLASDKQDAWDQETILISVDGKGQIIG